jgi:hypothetical protein
LVDTGAEIYALGGYPRGAAFATASVTRIRTWTVPNRP